VTTVWLAAGEQFQPASPEIVEQARLRYKLPDSYILFVSTIEPRKNIVGLLRAYACLRADIPDAPPLVLAGKRGWLYEDIMALYEEMRFGPDVIWLEDFSAVDLPAIYSGAVLFCLPSFYEGFGLTPLEAMACGTPVIVSDRASLPEVVGDAGLLVDPDSPEQIAERLARMLVNSDLADDLRSRGIARARQFTWRSTAQKTLAVYDRVLET
jgi:glycosyltransferase involved in cell wall biosynthesis